MNILSLFDGMSCGQLALQKAGIKYDNYFASEIDKYAIEVTQHHWPNTIQLGDVRNINSKDLPKIDLLIGGSPCQGFSFAGNNLNFKDPRSSLFFEYSRLLKEVKPKNFLLENVQMKKESEYVITAVMNIQPLKINSALVSAQNRVRLYWTNISNITQPEDKNINLCDILTDNSPTDRIKSYCIDANYYKGTNWNHYKKKSVRQLVGTAKNNRMLTPIECERLQTIPDNYTYVPVGNRMMSNTQRYKMLGNGWTVDVIAHIFKHLDR